MGKILQFPIKTLTDFPGFEEFYFAPSWLRDLPEETSGLNRVDRALLSLFIIHTNYDSVIKINMEYVLEEFKLIDTPTTRWGIDDAYNKLIRLGYIDLETKEWTYLLPWIPQSEVDRIWTSLRQPGKHSKRVLSEEKIAFRIFRNGYLKPPPEQKKSGKRHRTSSHIKTSSGPQKQTKIEDGNPQTEKNMTGKPNPGRSKKTHS